ncbi:MAG: hypothetical protein KAG94_05275, partial [Clostridiales bacterium]|nr:hypothetical protein [Clostridiales bacterium]
GSRVDDSVLAFTLENVSATAIVTIEIADVPTIYSGTAKGDLMSPASIEAYDEELAFVGKTAATGSATETVALKAWRDGEAILAVTKM